VAARVRPAFAFKTPSRPQALEARIRRRRHLDEGIRDLYRVADTGGVFCYTLFKGVGVRRG
jgi:hypothetical protein